MDLLKTFSFLAAFALALVALPVATQEAEAFGWCTQFTDSRCPTLACIGYRWTYPDPYYTCQYEIPPDWCRYFCCTCPPIQAAVYLP